jgi:acetolactate synthase-1/2/3 large subunit
MVALAETTGAAVSDVQSRLNFPTEHPLDCRMNKDVFKQADVILALDCRDWERPTHYNDRINRTLRAHYPDHCRWMDIGFADIEISKWAMGYQKFPECVARVLADTELAIPALTELCRDRVAKDWKAASRIAERKQAIAAMHDKTRAKWREESRENWNASPISVARLAMEVWEQIKSEDWVLTTNAFEDWALKLWEFGQALPLARQSSRHRNADRHGDRRGAGASRQGTARRRLPDRRRSDVRRGCALVRGEAQGAVALRHA